MPSLDALRSTWKTLYTITLPSLAKSHSPTQGVWPVHLDHCFARIILDHVIGQDQESWAKRLKSPAIKNMTGEQLEHVIELGKKIASGEVDLVELDKRSLEARGKKGKYASSTNNPKTSKFTSPVLERKKMKNNSERPLAEKRAKLA